MWLIELIGGIVESWTSWRFYICVVISVGIAIVLHKGFPDQDWIWFLTVPAVITGIGLGFWWQIKADDKA